MILNTSPLLRSQRDFPKDNMQALTVELDKAYIDIAQKVNDRMIGLFALDTQLPNGNIYYFQGSSSRRGGLRKMFNFTASGSIEHEINFSSVYSPIQIYGQYTDDSGTYYGIISGSTTSISGQVSAYIDDTYLYILADGSAPSISSGIVVLEWISNA